MLETVNQRIIKIYSKYLSMRAIDFARSIGMSKQIVSGLETATTYPGYRFIEGIAKSYPEINLRWLITGEGNMLCDGSFAPTVAPNKKLIESNTTETQLLIETLQAQLVDKERIIQDKEEIIGLLKEKIAQIYTQ